MAYEDEALIAQLPPELQDEILARNRAGKGSLVITKGKTAVAPQAPVDYPTEPTQPAGAFDILRGQWADEARHLQQKYQDEVEMAERFNRQQDMERLMGAGSLSPAALRSFQPSRPRFMNVGGDLLDVTSGTPRVVYDSPERVDYRTTQREQTTPPNIPLGVNMQWVYGPSGWVQQRIPPVSVEEAFAANMMRGRSGPANTPSLGPIQSAPQRQAVGGYKIGTRYRGLEYLGGDPADETSWR